MAFFSLILGMDYFFITPKPPKKIFYQKRFDFFFKITKVYALQKIEGKNQKQKMAGVYFMNLDRKEKNLELDQNYYTVDVIRFIHQQVPEQIKIFFIDGTHIIVDIYTIMSYENFEKYLKLTKLKYLEVFFPKNSKITIFVNIKKIQKTKKLSKFYES